MASYKPTPLLRHYVGKELCARVRGDGSEGGSLKLCIKGQKFGFTAWLHSKSGTDKLPVPTGDARSPKQALDNAKEFLRKVATKHN